jgi:D-alanyl-D-alanine carboxypeptidase/D-alanyl-D-alanine-endopeptidase (penicillin-binding protein 4)
MVLRTSRRAFVVCLAALAFLATGVGTPAALAGGGETVTITASAAVVPFDEPVTITGAVAGDAACVASRSVRLEWNVADSDAWAPVAEGTTADDGTFAFESSQQYTGRYRATVAEAPPCAALSSNTVPVRVRALVDASLLAGSLEAGSCVDLDVAVVPPKPGQTVDVQRGTPRGWTTIETLTLDEASRASTRPCFGWEDIGIVRLRARWTAQDPLNATSASVVLPFQITEASWMQRLDRLTAGYPMSVSLGRAGAFMYERLDAVGRTPASNEKLLLSMTLLDTLGAEYRILTHAASRARPVNGVVRGDLWILGRGDPQITRGRIATLASRIAAAGVTGIRGRVMGSTSFFRRDWWAAGWRRGISRDYVARPTALTFDGNVSHGLNVRDPEVRAARALTDKLEGLGVEVAGKPGSGPEPPGLTDVATVASPPLEDLLPPMNRPSSNFYAEVLGKLLGSQVSGIPGTIAKGAAAIQSWAGDHGVDIESHDNSGLSYANRVTAEGIVQLLWAADDEPWGRTLRFTLPRGGQGTLRHRLLHVTVRAKTGTLDGISALSGWVWLEREGTWAEFSILSTGLSKTTASSIEDKVVRAISNRARCAEVCRSTG